MLLRIGWDGRGCRPGEAEGTCCIPDESLKIAGVGSLQCSFDEQVPVIFHDSQFVSFEWCGRSPG